MTKEKIRTTAVISVGYIWLLAVLVKSVAGLISPPLSDDWDAIHDHFMLKVSIVVSLVSLLLYSVNLIIRRRYPDFRSSKKYYLSHWFIFFTATGFIASSVAFVFYSRVMVASGTEGADIVFIVTVLAFIAISAILTVKLGERLSNGFWWYHITIILKSFFFYVVTMALIAGITY